MRTITPRGVASFVAVAPGDSFLFFNLYFKRREFCATVIAVTERKFV
jgi:hypothetical protein